MPTTESSIFCRDCFHFGFETKNVHVTQSRSRIFITGFLFGLNRSQKFSAMVLRVSAIPLIIKHVLRPRIRVKTSNKNFKEPYLENQYQQKFLFVTKRKFILYTIKKFPTIFFISCSVSDLSLDLSCHIFIKNILHRNFKPLIFCWIFDHAYCFVTSRGWGASHLYTNIIVGPNALEDTTHSITQRKIQNLRNN